MTKAQLQRFIRSVVREEIEQTLQSKKMTEIIKEQILLKTPRIVQEIMDDELNESLSRLQSTKKRKNITENMDTLSFGTEDLSTIAYRNMNRAVEEDPRRRVSSGDGAYKNTITAVPAGNDATMLRPVDQREIPEYLKKALNKDYRSVLEASEEFRGAGAGRFVPPSINDLA